MQRVPGSRRLARQHGGHSGVPRTGSPRREVRWKSGRHLVYGHHAVRVRLRQPAVLRHERRGALRPHPAPGAALSGQSVDVGQAQGPAHPDVVQRPKPARHAARDQRALVGHVRRRVAIAERGGELLQRPVRDYRRGRGALGALDTSSRVINPR